MKQIKTEFITDLIFCRSSPPGPTFLLIHADVGIVFDFEKRIFGLSFSPSVFSPSNNPQQLRLVTRAELDENRKK